jgi:nucleoside-diphosphate-sugar epimerase
MGLVLVTGASGFVGRELCTELAGRKVATRAALRRGTSMAVHATELAEIDGVSAATDWTGLLRDVSTVIHLAARVHVMRDDVADPLEEFRKVNVAGTEGLARAAAEQGVKRLVFVSTIKVNGEATQAGERFTEADVPSPRDPYGISKWEAEQALHRVAADTGLEIVIVRPPLVYGAGAKGNFALLLRALRARIPMPLGAARNLRSLIYVGNLADALIACAMHPVAAGKTYVVSDGDDISTPDLLRGLGQAMRRPALLWPCSGMLLRLAGRLFGKPEEVERLLGSLCIDSSRIRRELNWTPPYSLQEGLQASVERGRQGNDEARV